MIKKFKYKLESPESETFGCIKLPFDVKNVFGKGRVPVKLTIKGYTYRTTIFHMGEVWSVPLRKEHRENAKVQSGEIVQISVESDTEARIVETPPALKKFLQNQQIWDLFDKLSYTHKKEFVQWIEGAKKDETRESRKQKMVGMLKKKEHL